MNIQFNNWQQINLNDVNNAFIAGVNEFNTLFDSFDPNLVTGGISTNTRLTGNWNTFVVDALGNHFIDSVSFQTFTSLSLIDPARNLFVSGNINQDLNTGLVSGFYNKYSYVSTNATGLTNLLFLGTLNVDSLGNLANSTLTQQNTTANGYTLNVAGNFSLDANGNVTGGTISSFTFADNLGHSLVGSGTSLNAIDFDQLTDPSTHTTLTDWYNYLTNSTRLAGNDTIIADAQDNNISGFAGNDSLSGGAGNDTLDGGLGSDTLDGGLGADSLNGGDGADTYIVDDVNDIVTEDNAFAAGGIDLVKSSASSFTLSANVENLTLLTVTTDINNLAANNINGTGNDLANIIIGNAGNNTLDGGAGIDNLAGGLGNDTYIVDLTATGLLQDTVTEGVSINDTADTIQLRGNSSNAIASMLTLGANIEILDASATGLSKLNLTGNTLNNTLIGNDANNLLSGLAGNDTLSGGAGNDTLDGGLGTDVLIGGAGDDTYLVDLITTATVIGTGANLGNNTPAFVSLQDQLIENADGIDTLSLRGSAVLISATTLDLSGNDSFGNPLTNIENLNASATGTTKLNLTGNSLNNILTGNATDNLINGGLGADTLIGGAGNDTFVVDDSNDRITELINGGIDAVQSSVTYSLNDNVENLTLTGADNINATGNALNNILVGNNGINTLIGGLGSDTLDGGLGADSLNGGDGADTYIVDDVNDIVTEDNAFAAGGIDLVKSSASSFTLSANVENLTLLTVTTDINNLAANNINGTGNDLANIIIGNAGNNTLDGGAGIDNLAGGLGNDTYIVDLTATGLLQDTVTEGVSINDTADTIQLRGNSSNAIASMLTLGANIEILDASATGLSKLNLTGNTLNNTLIGNDANNLLSGLAGNDTLSGGAGNDTLDGGLGTDVLIGGAGDDTYLVDLITTATVIGTGANLGNNTPAFVSLQDQLIENADGIDTLSLRGSAVLISATTLDLSGNDSFGNPLTNIENLNASATGTTKLNLTGNSLNNILTGNAAANILLGLDGNDSIDGGVGNDSLIGGLGNDSLDGGLGADTLDGGDGDDIYVVDIATDVINIDTSGTDIVKSSITYSIATRADLENIILIGAATINATGNDLANILMGNDAANILDGGIGADAMNGGKGNDTYIVDDVGDVVTEIFTLAQGGGIDLVKSSVTYDLSNNLDRANIDNLTLTDGSITGGTANIDAIGNDLANIIIGNAGNNLIAGNAGNDTLVGNAGDDYLDGGLGNDNMSGGTGNDIYIVDSVSDVVTESVTNALGGGIDTVKSTVTRTLGANFDDLVLLNATTDPLLLILNKINGTGNELANNITGNDGNNFLSGLAGNDNLDGGADNDTLDGGLGVDVLIGGTGNDNYIVDLNTTIAVVSLGTSAFVSLQDQIIENNGIAEGIDTLTLRGSAVLINATTIDLSGNDSFGNTLTNIENLNASATGTTKLNLVGNDLNNLIIGNAANNTLIGNAGNDTLDGGLGADTLFGGYGDDVYIIDNVNDVIVETPKKLVQLSTLSNGGFADSNSAYGTLSDDGRKLVFSSPAGNYVANDTNARGDIFVKDLITGDIQLVSTSTAGLQGTPSTSATPTGDGYGIFSHDGSSVLYKTDNLNLVSNTGTNPFEQIYIKNLTTGALSLVSANAAGDAGNDASDAMSISSNDRFVIFESDATNLVASATNGVRQLYIKDLITGSVQLVSTSSTAVQANGDSSYASFSADGNNIVFISYANNLVANDINNAADVFVKNLVTGTVSLVSADASGGIADGSSSHASFSADGRYVAFQTHAINLIPGLDNDATHTNLYRKDLQTGAIVAIDTSADGVIGNLQGEYPSLSADGRFAVFTSLANNLVANDTNNDFDVFVKDLLSGDIRMVSTHIDGSQFSGFSYVNPFNTSSISADGNTIIFEALDASIGGGVELVYAVTNPFKVGDGVDRVESSISFDLSAKGADVENLTLTGVAAINGTGNVFNNEIIGNDAANILDGKEGADTLIGGKGNDIYILDNLGDIVTESLTLAQGGGVDLVKASLSYTLTDNMDNLTLTGSDNISGFGNALSNVITGNSGNNTLNGLAGNDTILGGLGDDTLIGGSGVDNMSGGKGNDTYFVDLIKLGTGASSFVALQDVVNELANEGTADTIILTNLSGSNNAAVDLSLTNATTLILAASIENMDASQTGSTKLNITGNASANTIIGNDANNVLIGSLGSDTLKGGLGADVFKFNTTTESVVGLLHDVILDFGSFELDKIDLSVIDAQINVTGNQAFNFIGNNIGGDVVFTHHSGELIFDTTTESVLGDINGDGIADFEIELLGVNVMSASDFVL